MKKMKTSLMVLTMAASLMFSTIGMAEARSQNTNNNYHQYSQNHNTHNYNSNYRNTQYTQTKRNNNNYNQYTRNHRAQYVKNHQVKYVKQHRPHNNRYLYPALIGAGVGLLVLGMTR